LQQNIKQEDILKDYKVLDVKKYNFTNRVISEWNALPERAVTATLINSFKQAIQPYSNDVRGSV